MEGIRIISEFNGAYLLEVEGCGSSFRVAPITAGQRRNYAVWWENSCDPDTEPLFPIWNQYGEWRSHHTHHVDLLAVVRYELAYRGLLGEKAQRATGALRPVYRW
jgi:hypothetical protein